MGEIFGFGTSSYYSEPRYRLYSPQRRRQQRFTSHTSSIQIHNNLGKKDIMSSEPIDSQTPSKFIALLGGQIDSLLIPPVNKPAGEPTGQKIHESGDFVSAFYCSI